jgi:MarR family transcriptional regulator, organic hydroperoxide resistance regulator
MFDRCIYFNINALARVINRKWEEAFQRVGLPPSHAYLLRCVLARPGSAQKELAGELAIAPSTVTRAVDQLVNGGWLERRLGADGREALVYPTPKARKIGAALERTGDRLYRDTRAKLGARQFDALVASLRSGRTRLGSDDDSD